MNYADHPVSIAEARAVRSGAPEDWTPRDALVNLLRDIDSGRVNLDHLFIGWASMQDDGSAVTGFTQAGTLDSLAQLGLVYRVLDRFTQAGSEED